MDRIFGRDLTNLFEPLGLRNFANNKQFKSNKSLSMHQGKYTRNQDREKARQQKQTPMLIQLKEVKKQEAKKWAKKHQITQKVLQNNIQLVPYFMFAEENKYYRQNLLPSLGEGSTICEKVRGEMIDWVVQVHLKYKMTAPTLYMCVGVIDRYLAKKSVPKSQHSVLAAAAIYLSSKYEETYQVPKLSQLVYMAVKCISKKQILQMQADIITTLNFNLTMITPYSFFTPLLTLSNLPQQPRTKSLATYLLQLCLLNPKLNSYKPSILAASVMYLTNRIIHTNWTSEECWPEMLYTITSIQVAELKNCAKEVCILFQRIGDIAYGKNIKKKYAADEWHCVSKLQLQRKRESCF